MTMKRFNSATVRVSNHLCPTPQLTLAHKKRLRELGCSWSKNKQKWSWHFPEDAAVSYAGRKAWSMDRIRRQFGSEVLRRDSESQQAAGMRSAIVA